MIPLVDPITLAPVIASLLTSEAKGTSAMDQTIKTTATTSQARGRRPAPDCPGADGRVLLHRHAAFFAALATKNSQTADRVTAPEPEWTIAREKAA